MQDRCPVCASTMNISTGGSKCISCDYSTFHGLHPVKKEIQFDNVMAYEAGKADGIAEVLEYAKEWCGEVLRETKSLHFTKGTLLKACDLEAALLQKFGGKG